MNSAVYSHIIILSIRLPEKPALLYFTLKPRYSADELEGTLPIEFDYRNAIIK